MSKLATNIREFKTNNLKYGDAMPSVNITEDYNTIYKVDRLIEYKFGVRFETKGYVAEVNTNDLHRIVDAAKRQIIEEVFGEFRTYFRQIEMLLYQRDVHNALHKLRLFEEQMYSLTHKEQS